MYRWLIAAVVYAASINACFNQFKVPPATGLLMEYFHVGPVTVGWMMSVFAITCILLAFPSAILLRKVGPKKAGLIALGCICLGCVIGALAQDSAMLMCGRVIEGIGLGSMGVIAPAIIAMHFKGHEIGLPMGIWATWFPVGSTLGYDITHPVIHAFGAWQAIWWAGAISSAVIFVLYALIVRRPDEERTSAGTKGRHPKPEVSFTAALKQRRIWFLGFSFFFMTLGSLFFLTWAPEYFAEHFELERQAANSYASLGFMTSIPGGIIAGLVMTRFFNRMGTVVIICAIASMLVYPLGYILPFKAQVPFLVSTGFIMGFTCAAVFAMVPRVMGSRPLAGIGMGVILFAQGWANFLAMPTMGHIIEGGDWSKGSLPTLIVLIFAVVFAVLFAMAGKSEKEKDEAFA